MTVVVRDLCDDEVPAAAAVLAQASSDAPIASAVLGDARRREQTLRRLCASWLATSDGGLERICAHASDTVVGVAVLARHDACRRAPWPGRHMARLLPVLGARRWARTIAWLDALRIHDLDGPHMHLDPLALDPWFPARGAGAALLGEVTRRLDAAGQVGYAATGRREQLALHERHGFGVVWHTSVFGVMTWCLRRDPVVTAR